MNENIRKIVLDTLLVYETENKKSHLLIRDVLLKYDYLDKRDKAFFKRVTEGTILNRITLDYVLDSYSKKPMAKCKPVVRVLLRMSAYQLLFMDKIPKSAVCDEAVKLCRKDSFEEFCPFVNAVLRNIAKDGEKCLDFSRIEDETLRLSVKYSMPEFLVKMFVKEQPDAEKLLKALTTVTQTSVRIVDAKDETEILGKWKEAGVKYTQSIYAKHAYNIESFEGAELLYGFTDGKVIILDESSMLAAMATGIQKGDKVTVLDVCAAPGGKSTFVASLMNPYGTVISRDVSMLKVSLIDDNVARLNLSNVKTEVFDATCFDESMEEFADVVICDVPCSGLGVMARKSDIRYNVSNEGMKEICDLQKKIVENAAKYVKKGGVFVYSTCTIHKAENEKMVKYIESNTDLRLDSLKPVLPVLFEKTRPNDAYVQLRPDVDATDGFFVARFKRV